MLKFSILSSLKQSQKLKTVPFINYELIKQIHTSYPLNGQPMKRRKKVDVNIMLHRETRKIKRFEKEMRQISRRGEILKPILEIEGSPEFVKTKSLRARNFEISADNDAILQNDTFSDSERENILKQFGSYKMRKVNSIWKRLKLATDQQSQVLTHLKEKHPEWYKNAIKNVTFTNNTIELKSPKASAPNTSHIPPEGDYVDITPKYDKL